jgi:hypothetical protein
MTGLMNPRTLKNFVSHSQFIRAPKNEVSLGIFEWDLLSQIMELLVSQEAADANFKVSLTYLIFRLLIAKVYRAPRALISELRIPLRLLYIQ